MFNTASKLIGRQRERKKVLSPLVKFCTVTAYFTCVAILSGAIEPGRAAKFCSAPTKFCSAPSSLTMFQRLAYLCVRVAETVESIDSECKINIKIS